MSPEPAYLQLIGQLAYEVSSLEWIVIADLNSLSPPLDGFDVAEFAGLTTAQIGKQIRRFLPTVEHDPTLHRFIATAADALEDIAERRNHVLHARPASDHNRRTRLYRWRKHKGQVQAFFITDKYLDEQIAAIREWRRKVGRGRRAESVG